MFQHYPVQKVNHIRFRRWSRKGYAVFSSLSRCVTIGTVCASICDMSFRKSSSLSLKKTSQFIGAEAKDNEEGDSPEDLLFAQKLIQELLICNFTNVSVAAPASNRKITKYIYQPAVAISLAYCNRFFYLIMKRKIFTFLLCLSVSNYFIYAGETEDEAIELSTVQVSGKSQKLYSELGRILTVIDKNEINATAAQSIDELLEYIAGLDVRQRGTGGVQADISIRGGSFDQVLVLLNGVNITDPQTGHYNLDIPIDISDITRIEVLQGSAARVLGINAFSGAINIITEVDKKKELAAQVTYGSYNTTMQNVTASYNIDHFSAFASASHQASDGYRDNTDYDLSNAFLHLNQKTENAGNWGFQAAMQQKSFGANGFYSLAYPNQFDHTKTFFSALTWSIHKNKWKTDAQVYWRQHHNRFELFRNAEGAASWYTNHNYHRTDVAGGRTTASFFSGIGKITAGVDLRYEHIYSNVLGEQMSNTRPVPFEKNAVFTHEAGRFLKGLFIDYSKNFNQFYLSAGGAFNHTQTFGFQYFGGIDIGYQLNEPLNLFASFNSAVRLPTFTDLYYKSATQLSNPNLQPERSKTIEAGAKYHPGNWSIDACAFYRMGEDIIDWVKQPDSIRWESRNLTNINAFGIDFTFNYTFDHSFVKQVGVVYSYLQLDKKAEDFDSKYALDYLKHKILISVHHHIWKNLSASWKGSFIDRAGDYTDFQSGEKVNYDPYILLDARLLWSEKRFDIYADINNILNTQYTDFGGLPLPGINWNIGVKLRVN